MLMLSHIEALLGHVAELPSFWSALADEAPHSCPDILSVLAANGLPLAQQLVSVCVCFLTTEPRRRPATSGGLPHISSDISCTLSAVWNTFHS